MKMLSVFRMVREEVEGGQQRNARGAFQRRLAGWWTIITLLARTYLNSELVLSRVSDRAALYCLYSSQHIAIVKEWIAYEKIAKLFVS